MMSQELRRLIDLFRDCYPDAVPDWIAWVSDLEVWKEVERLADAYAEQNSLIKDECEKCGTINCPLAEREQHWCSNGGVSRFGFAKHGLFGVVSTDGWNAFALLLFASEHACVFRYIHGYLPPLTELFNGPAEAWNERLKLRFLPVRLKESCTESIAVQ